MIETSRTSETSAHAALAVVDCDIHNVVPSIGALLPYMSREWRDFIEKTAFPGPADTPYPPHAPTSARPGTTPPTGGPPGSDLDLLRAQVLDPWNVEHGILNCSYGIESIKNPDLAAALASAVNDWQVAEWLDREPRLRASIVVPSQQPELAAREIDRVADQPGFVQIYLPIRSRDLYGNRIYHPIYDAAVRHDLAIGLHFGGAPGVPPTSSGWPTYYLEEYVGMAHISQSQILNMIVEGVFDQFPTLRVALIECGFSWLPAFMWRVDKEWKQLRREVPWNKHPLSDYIRRHLHLTIQPLDEPPDRSDLTQVVEQIGSDDVLMFSTDYPHWHFDSPEEALPAGLSPHLRRKILRDNAHAFYRLGS